MRTSSFRSVPTSSSENGRIVNPYHARASRRLSSPRTCLLLVMLLPPAAVFIFWGPNKVEVPVVIVGWRSGGSDAKNSPEALAQQQQAWDEERQCQATCHDKDTRPPQRDTSTATLDQDYFGINLLDINQVATRLQTQRKALQDKLKSHDYYGEHLYLQLFEPLVDVPTHRAGTTTIRQRVSVGRNKAYKSPSNLVTPNNNANATTRTTSSPGWKGLKRKLELKLLELQLKVLQERSRVCRTQCLDDLRNTTTTALVPSMYHARFIWATGGDG